MTKVRDALLEVVVIIIVGGLIGAVLAIVSNLFVTGVQWFGQQRAASDMFSLTVGGESLSFSSVVFLWGRRRCGGDLKNRSRYRPLGGSSRLNVCRPSGQ